MEGCSITHLLEGFPEVNKLFNKEDKYFLNALQFIHDEISVDNWEFSLYALAISHNLET